jgi:hypothetical protein
MKGRIPQIGKSPKVQKFVEPNGSSLSIFVDGPAGPQDQALHLFDIPPTPRSIVGPTHAVVEWMRRIGWKAIRTNAVRIAIALDLAFVAMAIVA